MNTFWRTHLRPAIVVLLGLTLLTGIAYPAAVTAVAQLAFPDQANGSLIIVDGRTLGSSLIGQAFNSPRHFRSRPSAAGDGHDANASAGSNLSPTSQELIDRIAADVDRIRAESGTGAIPLDLVTASASGLDPHISPAAAEHQVARVAAARGLSESDVRTAVARHTEGQLLGFLGQARINVLELNLDLDGVVR